MEHLAMRRALFVFAAPLVLLIAPACAPAAGAALSPEPEQITIVGMDDFRMNPSTVTVQVGQPLQVTFQNTGEILHDFTAEQGLLKPVTVLADGGESGTATVSYAKPGTYKFFCAQPGHDQLGMHGTITVS
jgi:uncharacterized cupredoxin-like copper-binding protein